MSTRPRARARPSIDVASAGSTIAGNSVTMSMRMVTMPLELQQPLRGPDHDPPRLQIHVAHDVGHRGYEVLARPLADHPEILRRPRLDSQDSPHLASVLRQHAAALELPGVEVSLGRRQRVRLGHRE